jgi:hypothetical protein
MIHEFEMGKNIKRQGRIVVAFAQRDFEIRRKYLQNRNLKRYCYINLRHCAKSREVAGSIPDGIVGIFIVLILPAALWPCGMLSR